VRADEAPPSRARDPCPGTVSERLGNKAGAGARRERLGSRQGAMGTSASVAAGPSADGRSQNALAPASRSHPTAHWAMLTSATGPEGAAPEQGP